MSNELYITDSINLDIDDDKILYIVNPDKNLDINLHIKDNSNVIIYYFNNTTSDINMLIEQDNNTTFNMYHTFRIHDRYDFKYKVKLNGNNNLNNVYIHGVSNGQVNLDVDGILTSKHKNNEVNEDIRVLTIHGNCFISPQLHVSALDVIANHNTAISNINPDELFYLMSHGISKSKSILLIENGYVYGLYKDNKKFLDIVKDADKHE